MPRPSAEPRRKPVFGPLLLALCLAASGALEAAAAGAEPSPAGAGGPAKGEAPSSAPLPQPMTAPEYRLGNPKARVTLVEYASDTCPHCAKFGLEVFPEVRKAYIDTGKVLYVFRELPTPPEDLSAAGFLIARCAGEAKYLDVVEALFRAQKTAQSTFDFLTAGARAAGLSEGQMKACIDDPKAIAALNARVDGVLNKDKVASTPTFVVNGRRLALGEKSFDDIKAAVDPLLGARPRKGRRVAAG